MKKLLLLLAFFSSMAWGKVEVVVFDCGGVLIEVNKPKYINFIANTFHISHGDARALLCRLKFAMDRGVPAKTFWENYALQNEKHLPQNWIERVEDVKLSCITSIPGIFDLIEHLKKKGFQVALFSNVREDQASVLRQMGFYKPFDPVVLSCEIGIKKPERRAYEILLRELKVKPKKVIFIDNKIENIEAAYSMGIDGIQFESVDQVKKELVKRNILTEKISRFSKQRDI